ncbi:YciI-like protein [Bartonella sp. LJL80]
MLYAVICNDKKDHLQLRLDTRPVHLEYLQGLGATLKFAGPFVDDQGKANGTLMVVEAQTLEEAAAYAAGDPYAKAGLFANTEIRPWNWTINNPQAG